MRLTRRQRKKRHWGEFQELLFEVAIQFRSPLGESTYLAFWESLVEILESRRLQIGGLGGRFPCRETEGVISTIGPDPDVESSRKQVLDWLAAHPWVQDVSAGPLEDAWYLD